MTTTYIVTCNLIEIQKCKEQVMEIVRKNGCIGYSGTGDEITFHFTKAKSAMMTFLDLDDLLNIAFVSGQPYLIDETKLKGVFKYDQS